MPRIDPLSLLKCLSVLLGPAGGIKSKEEVHRLANLMTKFSKKLVSKCIYIQILKSTNAELLNQFMSDGGWNLIHMWLTDGIVAKNWALIQELLELLLLCPVDIDRLKSNNCPKLIKGLSKEGSHQGVRLLASRLVEQWLKIVKGEAAPNTIPLQIAVNQQSAPTGFQTRQQAVEVVKQEQKEAIENSTIKVQDLNISTNNSLVRDPTPVQQTQTIVPQTQQLVQEQIHIQPVQLQIVNKTFPGQLQPTQIKKQSFVVVSNASQNSTSCPLYKITIRDGKQVITKIETDASNITIFNNDSANSNNNSSTVVNGELTQDVKDETNEPLTATENGKEYDDGVSDVVKSEVKQESIINNENQIDVTDSSKIDIDNKDDNNIVNSELNKSSDKENRDSQKKDDKSSSSSSDKKSSHHQSSSKSTSKHSSTSSSSRSSSNSRKSSSHRPSGSKSSSSSSKSSKDKDSKHHSSKHSSSSSSSSSKNKSEKEKEREKEKEKLKKDQAEKDKATLEKVQGQSLGSKFGKIPKKKPEDEKTDSVRKSSTESRESSKENKDKSDSKDKKTSMSPTILEKKNISISIENRKNSQDSARPKTVKTFNSKFRSTGLEEEVKPPPPRTASKKANNAADKKIIPPKLPTLKRASPIRETGATADKKAKLALDTPVTLTDDKKGGIKLIPPKPKPMVLQESDMFMDALTASTKNKEPRKRKRRTSVSKDGSNEAKKSEGANSVSGDHNARDTTPPPSSSPQGADERSPLSIKPEFKFYQDTLETDEDKDEKEKEDKDVEMTEDTSKKEKITNEDDERSLTPTNEDEVEDMKGPASPDDPEDTGRKESESPQSEIRYVDGLKSVLLLQKRRGPKKTLKWKTELESIKYFELDETERVNVTKTFTDMKQMEKQNEREAFQMARKLSNEDLMEERTRWKVLIPIDLPPPLVEPGKDSKEKDIQYAREKGILQALYFNRSMIPDSAAEPDEERHHVFTDPKIIPLDDLTGNKESEKDFTSVPWPEPKPQLPPATPVIQNVHFPTFPQHNQQMPPMQMPPNPLGPMNPMPPQLNQTMMPPINHMPPNVQDMNAGAGGWRSGDGKVVVPDVQMNNINNMPNMPGNMPPGFPPPGMENPMMPNMMPPPPGMFNQQDGYPNMMGGEDGSYGHMPNNFQGPAMFGPGPNFQNGPNMPRGVGPMHGGNRGRGGPGWFRGGGVGGGGGGVGPMRGGWVGRGGWRGNGKQPPVCRQFTKNGYCRIGEKCQYLHPGVNCPPF